MTFITCDSLLHQGSASGGMADMRTHANAQKKSARRMPIAAPATDNNAAPAITTESAPLTPQSLPQLQRTYGNQYVQRLVQRQTNPKTAGFIQSKLTPSARRIHRRVPDATETAALVGDKDAGIASINVQGLKTAIKRLFKDLPAPMWLQVY